MPTGPHHYREANRFANTASQLDVEAGATAAAIAQVHATNAQTAAIITLAEILDHIAGGGGHIDLAGWRKVIPHPEG